MKDGVLSAFADVLHSSLWTINEPSAFADGSPVHIDDPFGSRNMNVITPGRAHLFCVSLCAALADA